MEREATLTISNEGRTAIVAAGGLDRACALELARRGARAVVNEGRASMRQAHPIPL